jgi:hypothetical protein
MIDIIREIEKIISESTPEKKIFPKKRFILGVIVAIIAPNFLYHYLLSTDLNFSYSFIIFLITLVILLVSVIFFNDLHLKKELEKMGITPSKGFLSNWKNENYYKYLNRTLKKNITDKQILTTKLELNISLLNEYSNHFKLKAKEDNLIFWEKLKTIGVISLAMFTPIWFFLIKLTFDSFLIDKKLGYTYFSIDLMIIAMIFSVIILKYSLMDNSNRKKIKLEMISSLLLNLKWNLEIEQNTKKIKMKQK